MATRGETQEENRYKGREHWLACQRCVGETRHVVRGSVDTMESDDDIDVRVWNSFQVVECAGCGWLSFRHQYGSSENEDNEKPLAMLYPARLAGEKPLEHANHLPPQVRRIYEEAHAAMRSQLDILAAIGIRALVEAVCSHEEKGIVDASASRMLRNRGCRATLPRSAP